MQSKFPQNSAKQGIRSYCNIAQDKHRQMETKLEESVKGAASHGASWRVPFMLFCIVACAAFVYLGASVRTLKKRDKGF